MRDFEIIQFRRHMEALALEYFEPEEFLVHCNVKPNSYPPSELWGRIDETAMILDVIRYEAKVPIRITSCYRNKEYNKKVGGTHFSRHLEFNAIDFQSDKMLAEDLHAIALRLRRAGKFLGGLGKYSTFVHIDTRGHNASW